MTNTPTDKEAVEKIAKIKARADAATPGPWSGKIEPQNYPESDDADLPGFVRDPERREICYIGERYNYTSYETDLTFIAHAREDVPWLLAELERVTTELDALKAELKPIICMHDFRVNSDGDQLCAKCGAAHESDFPEMNRLMRRVIDLQAQLSAAQAAGTFSEGVEAAAKAVAILLAEYKDDPNDYSPKTVLHLAMSAIRALTNQPKSRQEI